MFDVEGISSRLINIRDEIVGLQTSKERYKKSELASNVDLKVLETKKEVLKKAADVLLKLQELTSEKGLRALTEMVTASLQQVFDDRNYFFEAEVEDKRGVKTIKLNLAEKTGDVVLTSSVRNEIGGGVRAVIGLICQCFYIKTLGIDRTLFIDESLSQLSDDYIDNLFTLMRSLSEMGEFKFVLVTHDVRFIPYADILYRCEMGDFRRVKDAK